MPGYAIRLFALGGGRLPFDLRLPFACPGTIMGRKNRHWNGGKVYCAIFAPHNAPGLRYITALYCTALFSARHIGHWNGGKVYCAYMAGRKLKEPCLLVRAQVPSRCPLWCPAAPLRYAARTKKGAYKEN